MDYRVSLPPLSSYLPPELQTWIIAATESSEVDSSWRRRKKRRLQNHRQEGRQKSDSRKDSESQF